MPPVRRMTCARHGRCAGADPVPAPGPGQPRNGAPGGKGEDQAKAPDRPAGPADAACTGQRRAAEAAARRGRFHRNRPGAGAIIRRNRIGKALRHGDAGPVWVTPGLDGTARVVNDGPPVPPPGPAALPGRFVPGRDAGAGSGTGLAIVRTGAGRIGPPPRLMSPRAGKDTGFSACTGLHGAILQKREHSR